MAGGIACLVAAAVLLWLSPRAFARTGTLLVFVAFVLFGVARGEAHRVRAAAQQHHVAVDPVATWIDAAVVEPPARGGSAPTAIVRIDAADPPLRPGTMARLRFPEGTSLEWGDRFQALAWVSQPTGRRNPGGFDAAAAAAARGRAAQGRVLRVTAADSVGWHAWPRATVARWRRGIERSLAVHLSVEARELVTPLMTGDRSALTPDLRGALQRSGLVHLLALSGLHVTWLAGVARMLVVVSGGGPVARALAGAVCALCYVGLAGPLPSLLRAAFMECMSTAAQLTERELDPVQSLSVTILVLLSCFPGWALDPAFQLSCAATLGLVTLLPWIAVQARRWRGAVVVAAVTVCAQIPTLPLLLLYFYGVSWSVAGSNVVAAPIVGLLLAAAWGAVLLDGLLPGAGSVGFAACEWLARALSQVAAFGARVPDAMLPAGHHAGGPLLLGAGALLTCWAASVRVPRLLAPTLDAMRIRAAVVGFALCVAGVFAGVAPAPLRPPRQHVWVVMLDVGQGQAMALGFHEGWWLVDAGMRTPYFDVGESTVLPFFRTLGVRRLHTLVGTHGDMDHVGGVPAVRRTLHPTRTVGSGGEPVVAGDVLREADAPVHVLWPAAGGASHSRNDSSVVLLLDAPQRALFTADADSSAEDALEVPGTVHVLQVGHHGAASSTGAMFIRRVRPRWAVVSAGRRNRFGHPDSLTLARLRAIGARVLRTDLEGAVWLELTPEGVRSIDWRNGLPHRPEPPPGARPVLARPNPHC